jgi:predicted phosphoribosyltransferase
MIHNDQELATAQERIRYFSNLLSQLRLTATPDEFGAVASGYRAEIELMQNEVLDYLTRHSSESTPAEAA